MTVGWTKRVKTLHRVQMKAYSRAARRPPRRQRQPIASALVAGGVRALCRSTCTASYQRTRRASDVRRRRALLCDEAEGRFERESRAGACVPSASARMDLGLRVRPIIVGIGRALDRMNAYLLRCTPHPENWTPRIDRLNVGDWKCAPKARIISGGRFHPESCRLIRKLTSGLAV